jgi:undecaprenyl diphosphate synthase
LDNSLKHLAVVVDGLARVMIGDACSPAETGAEALRVLLRIAGETFRLLPEITALSLFSPELQEWARSPSHSSKLYSRCQPLFPELEKCAIANRADIFLLGRLSDLPEPWPEVRSLAAARPTQSRQINFFLNYSGRDELTEAAERCLADHPEAEVSEKTFASYLATAGQPDPDLVIYSGGELEPKDFLLWQASYAEIWHSPGDCRLFSGEDLRRAVESFFHRHRRFGRV